jgi:acetyl-CoA C-acetyltransferase
VNPADYAITGAAEADVRRAAGRSALILQAEAARDAVLDAGLRLDDVDAVFAHVDDRFACLQVSEYLGIRPRYVGSTNVGGMSNMCQLIHAMLAIDAGLCRTALVTYGSTQASDASRRLGGPPDDPRSPRGQFISPYGQLTPLGFYAMAARRHMHEYGTRPEELAAVAVAAREWARLNPKAARREPLTIDECLASPYVAEPLRQRDCCLVTDGGGALVVTTLERARDLRRVPVRVRGHASGFSHHFVPFDLDDWLDIGVADGTQRALRMAGIERSDLDCVQIYDHFTIAVIQTLEAMGFCEKGEGGRFVSGGRIAPGGAFPLNTSGGGLSYNHPGMFGMLLMVEAVRQLRGECGARQIPDAKLCLVFGAALVFSGYTVLVLERDGG